MKKAMKKLMAALLAVAMVCAMAIPAFAASGSSPTDKGSITISNAVKDETYTLYKMFDLKSFDTDANDGAGTYSYTVDSNWKAFFATGAEGANYITLDANGHPTWVSGANAPEFAQKALAWAKTQPAITAAATSQDAGSTTVTFSNLALGYYLVDTSLGALCGLDTTKPNATIEEKNVEPTIDKTVETSHNNWATENTAKIGDTVNYKVTITVQTANNRYVLHDTMSDGLTFNKDSVKVTVNNTVVDATNHYRLVTENIGGETFNIKFEDSYIATLAAGTKIEVTYSAVVNANAKVDSKENTNEAYLVYGSNHKTTHEKTNTNLYQFDLIKYCGTSGKLLGGAQFKLYDAETNGTEIKLVKNADGTYRVATATETPVAYIETVAGETVKISGLDKKVYWLDEIVPPAGYNGLTERVEVDLQTSSKNADPTKIDAGKIDVANAAQVGGVAVMNNAGTTLPGTGGIGTTIFYVVGGGLMVAAAILLITKKRMENR